MHAQDTHEFDADLVVGALRHRLLLIVVCALLGLGLGWYYSATQPPAYVGSASVLINPVEGNPYSPTDQNDDLTSLETEAQLVHADAVLKMVHEQLRASVTPEQLDENVSVVVPPNTQIIQISYVDADPVVARDTTQAFATAYLNYRRQRADDVVAAQLAGVERQMDEVLADLRDATNAAQEGDAATRAFQTELSDALNSELIDLRAQRIGLKNTISRPGRVIAPAQLPVGAGGLTELLIPVGGAVGGLLFGFVLALVLERKRGLAYTAHDVETAGMPVLASVPNGSFWNRRGESSAALMQEAVRRARAAVLSVAQPGSAVAVARCDEGGLEPGLASRLSSSLVSAGQDVVLVDAEGGGQTAELTWNDDGAGLTDILAEPSDPVLPTVVSSTDASVRVLPQGRHATEAADYFVQSRIGPALATLGREYDIVVLRSPTLRRSQGEALSRSADLTIVVVFSGRTKWVEIAGAAKRAQESGAAILGAVVLPRSRGRAARKERRARQRRAAGVLHSEVGSSATSVGARVAASRRKAGRTERHRSTPVRTR